MFRAFKPFIERYTPSLAYLYRIWRDDHHRRHMTPVETPLGFKLGGNSSMQSGEFELELVALLRSLLHSAHVFVDIGANIGYYTCLARSMEKTVVAVEPLNQNLALLYENLRANRWDHVEVLPVALGKQSGLATLYGATTGASLVKGWANTSPMLATTVPVTTLDIVLGCRFLGERIVIKVDVEGAEHSLLQGATQLLRREQAPIWVMEIALTGSHPGKNPNYQQTFMLFFEHGYHAYTAGDTLIPVTPQDVEQWYEKGVCERDYENYVFSREPLDQ